MNIVSKVRVLQNASLYRTIPVLALNRFKSTKIIKEVLSVENNVKLTWENEKCAHVFPSVWLRDNCQCPECYHPSTKSRRFFTKDLDVDIKPKETFLDGKNKLVVVWPDDHESKYESDWLEARVFTPENIEKRRRFVHGPAKKLWGSEHSVYNSKHDFHSIMEKDEPLLHMLKDLQRFGITIVSGLPENSSLVKVIERIAFPRATHYGTYFCVEAKNDPNNLAYTTNILDLHIDLPYYYFNPSVQFLHCVKQCSSEGGDNEFVDGFKVSDFIKKNHPKDWEVLTTTKLSFWDVGSDTFGKFNKASLLPTIQLNDEGEVIRINLSTQVRDSHLAVPAEKVLEVYRALKLFHDTAYKTEHIITHKLKQGECVIFDNQRILHGRRRFELKEGDSRIIKGAYIDWDEIKSKIRVLEYPNEFETK